MRSMRELFDLTKESPLKAAREIMWLEEKVEALVEAGGGVVSFIKHPGSKEFGRRINALDVAVKRARK